MATWLNGVWFDGCNQLNGHMLEAKGNCAFFLDPDGTWNMDLGEGSYYSIRSQMKAQSAAAALDGREVEWHVQQEPVDDVFRKWAKELSLTNIDVRYDPWPRR